MQEKKSQGGLQVLEAEQAEKWSCHCCNGDMCGMSQFGKDD